MNPPDATLQMITKLKFGYNIILTKHIGSLFYKTKQNTSSLETSCTVCQPDNLDLSKLPVPFTKLKAKMVNELHPQKRLINPWLNFMKNYVNLNAQINQETINEFPRNCRLNTLNTEAVQAQDTEITLEENKTAIMQFPNNKALGFKLNFIIHICLVLSSYSCRC